MRSRVGRQMIGAGTGLLLDRVLGEPGVLHPVAMFGKTMNRVEELLWRGSKASGLNYGVLGVSLAAIASRLVRSPFVGTAVATYIAVAERSLIENAERIRSSLLAGDLESARAALPSLVGRDTSDLDEFEAARAIVESLAENSSDAVIAPMLYGAVFGGGGALVYRAINTMDAMVGYKSPEYHEFGWFCASLDDCANYIPSRTAAFLAWLVPLGMRPGIDSVLRDASKHPSPNAGVIEAMYSHKLNIRFGGENSYKGRRELRPEMGAGLPPSSADVSRASRLCRMSDTFFGLVLIAGGVALAFWPKGEE